MRFAPLLALVLLAAPALAQDDTLIAEGKRLSEINCTRCHNIEATGESPLTDAPPFRELAKNYTPGELTDGFMEGLAVRHPLMPDWEVTEPQAGALTAFIMSLKGPDQEKTDDNPILRGHTLLVENCARCHAIDAAGQSPEPKAPPFRDVVKKYDPSALEEALAEGIVTGHDKMPEFAFEPADISAITAYLDTLKAN
jgi:mono/diheme cytochrome c family protein